MKLVVHKYFPIFKDGTGYETWCGIHTNQSAYYFSVSKTWRGVTCKKCLSHKGEHILADTRNAHFRIKKCALDWKRVQKKHR